MAEPVSCHEQQQMKITAVARFDTELANRVEWLKVTALEQLAGENHLSWDVPGAHPSLFSFLNEVSAYYYTVSCHQIWPVLEQALWMQTPCGTGLFLPCCMRCTPSADLQTPMQLLISLCLL